jgi:hypothetical protein
MVLTQLFYLEPDIAASTAGVHGSYQPDGATGMTINGLFVPLRATAQIRLAVAGTVRVPRRAQTR